MFQHTRPAEFDGDGDPDPDRWAEFRVAGPQEQLQLLRELRDGSLPVMLNAPDGCTLSTTLWAIDTERASLAFNADRGLPQISRLVDADEAVAVAYLESVKLQFDLHGFTLVHGAQTSALRCDWPREIYRFQRRGAYRVRPAGRRSPIARLRHPALPEMQLSLRVIDLSIGGCALALPAGVPPLPVGTLVTDVHIELDDDTRFTTMLRLQHASAFGRGDAQDAAAPGLRLGCQWQLPDGSAGRSLQRWIDRTQQRRRLLTLD